MARSSEGSFFGRSRVAKRKRNAEMGGRLTYEKTIQMGRKWGKGGETAARTSSAAFTTGGDANAHQSQRGKLRTGGRTVDLQLGGEKRGTATTGENASCRPMRN